MSDSSCSSSDGLACFGGLGFFAFFGFARSGSGGREARVARGDVLGPAAVVGADRPVLERERPVGDPIQQRSVVGHEQHRARERVERCLERLAALEVEVVRRLVEQEQVCPGSDYEREREPAPLAA